MQIKRTMTTRKVAEEAIFAEQLRREEPLILLEGLSWL
jgi:hypothetical protein